MPYEIKQSSKGYCVHKQDGGPVPGGCHKSKSKALRHMRALYANEPEAMKEGKGYGARAGETISGNLVRGSDGKFASAGNAPPAKTEEDEKPRARRQRLGRTEARQAAAKLQAREDKRRATASASEAKRLARRQETERRRAAIKKQREQQAKEQEIARLRKLAASRQAVIDETQLDSASLSALEKFAKGGNPEPGDTTDMLVAMGLVSKSPNTGEYVMSSQGKGLLSAIGSGDVRQAKDAINAGLEARATTRNRRIKKDERERKKQEEESNKEASLSVFKDATGRFRWVLLSSNAYRDRDGEIVSTKALLEDVARADKDRDYGPLRWWHVPGLDIGDCDFNAMSGRVLVESGTFRSEAIGQSVFKAQKGLQASIGFKHPHTDPDLDKVYWRIRRFERSLTPTGRASNPFTKLVVQQERKMDTEKVEALKALIGEDGIQAILSQVQATQKEADLAGTAFKESTAETSAPAMTAQQVADYLKNEEATVTVGSTGGEFGTISIGTTGTFTVPSSETSAETEEETPVYAGDLMPQELVSLITANVVEALSPLMATKMKELSDALKAALSTTTKADDIALLQEQQSQQAARLEATIKSLAGEHEKTTQALKAAQAQLAELTGEQPRANTREQVKGYRATQDPNTVVGETHRLKEAAPQGIDPNFFDSLIPGIFNRNGANNEPPNY